MSSSMYRSQLERKRQQRLDSETKAGTLRSKESAERTRAAKARAEASRASASTSASKLREAERADAAAAAAGRDAGRRQDEASRYAKEEVNLQRSLANAERSEADAARRKTERARRLSDARDAAERRTWEMRLANTEAVMDDVVRHQLRAPKPEKLRVLLLGSSSAGDLRVGREQRRIRNAVESALHRDLIQLDVRPAATIADLLDGITKFRPHVVHFSGHGDETLVEFEDDLDELHAGVIVTAKAFASAIRASDTPPLLVLLNACNSARHLDALVGDVIPLAIGMADEIEDGDAIAFAAQFYAAVANGQSVRSAHLSGCAALELGGLASADFPVLVAAPGIDSAVVFLVEPPQ